MRGHATLARFAAPAAFLLAATIAVLIVRAALTDGDAATTPPAATTTVQTTTANPTDTGSAETTPPAGAQYYKIRAGDTLAVVAGAVQHDGRAADGAQSGRRPRRADDRPAHTRQVESAPP